MTFYRGAWEVDDDGPSRPVDLAHRREWIDEWELGDDVCFELIVYSPSRIAELARTALTRAAARIGTPEAFQQARLLAE